MNGSCGRLCFLTRARSRGVEADAEAEAEAEAGAGLVEGRRGGVELQSGPWQPLGNRLAGVIRRRPLGTVPMSRYLLLQTQRS